MTKIYFKWDAGYNTEGIGTIEHKKCVCCGESARCLLMDPSNEEYKVGPVCLRCIMIAFEDAAS